MKQTKTVDTSTPRVESYRDGQKRRGRDRKEYYVTPHEHKALQKYLQEMRINKKGKDHD